ncbi:thiamine pyrophosphate-dependent enzyme, partial [Chloroflexota bacterium]
LSVTLEGDRISQGYRTDDAYQFQAAQYNQEWDAIVDEIYNLEHGVPISQGEVIGVINENSRPQDVVVCAAGSLPGDLHKLWRTRDPKGYHLEYGFSCMGYEIAGGLGVKMADPDREVFVMVGDGSYLMMAQEIVTAVQEGIKLTIIVLNNHGYASIGGLSESIGSEGFGTRYLQRNTDTNQLDGNRLPVDFAANARSLGAHVISAVDKSSLEAAIQMVKTQSSTTVIVIETDREQSVPGYAWWDVPVAEVSTLTSVQEKYDEYIKARKKERHFL